MKLVNTNEESLAENLRKLRKRHTILHSVPLK